MIFGVGDIVKNSANVKGMEGDVFKNLWTGTTFVRDIKSIYAWLRQKTDVWIRT